MSQRLLLGVAVAAAAFVLVTRDGGGPPEPVRLEVVSEHGRPPVPDGYTARVVEGAWRLDDIDDHLLHVTVFAGDCLYFDHADAVFDDDAIDIKVYVEEWVPSRDGTSCLMTSRLDVARLQLPEPVDGRDVTGATAN